MSSKLENIIGQKFGKLIVLKYLNNDKNKSRIWECKCDCGKIIQVKTSDLKGKRKIHCNNKIHTSRWSGYEEISKSFMYGIKDGAKKRDLEFNISIEYIWDLFLKQNKKCALSGLELNFSSSQRSRNGNASLDRINSDKGYIEGNIQWLDKDINNIKQDHDEKYFIDLCLKIVKHKGLL